jgi:hypothetical protein
MTKDDIICMAREAGFELDCCSLEWHGRIERFAALVAAAEREACAKVCEAQYIPDLSLQDYAANRCAAAIRARGQA